MEAKDPKPAPKKKAPASAAKSKPAEALSQTAKAGAAEATAKAGPAQPVAKAAPAETPKSKVVPAAPAAKLPVSKPAEALAKAGNGELRPAPAPKFGDIPWSYGLTRITGLVRDPDWIFLYWEISDVAIADARQKAGDDQAGCCLRIYDTTNVEFNGLNPHRMWDIGVDRGANTYTLKVGAPGATFHVDIGVVARSGLYVPIARSGAIEMPRDSVSPDHRVDWSTVVRSGTPSTYRHRHTAPPAQHHAGSAPPPPTSQPQASGAWPNPPGGPTDVEGIFRHFEAEGWNRSEWVETRMEGRIIRWVKWSGPFSRDQFPTAPAGVYSKIEVLFQGERRVVVTEQGERFVYGPWHAVLEAVTDSGERKTIHQWFVRHRWSTEETTVRVETPAILTRILTGERVVFESGASEQRLLRENWGSEMLQKGASEWRWPGASETLMQGSSEIQSLGGSEVWWMGGSEVVRRGASELRWGGSSELWALGASERLLGQSSDYVPPGSSEERP